MAEHPPERSGAEAIWHRGWYEGGRWVYGLLPLTGLFHLLSALRRRYLARYRQTRLSVPVIIVGNISVGGTGKTPLIIALAEHLRARGYRPGIVSRGYGGRAPAYPLEVMEDTPVAHSGDEPLAIARATGCPVCVGPDRVAAAEQLQRRGCDLILGDDGLQHYRLGRDLEIAVVDARRGFGNGFCLPVGPLREPLSRLESVDWVVVNGTAEQTLPLPERTPSAIMAVVPRAWHPVAGGEPQPLELFGADREVDAVAGIGNPARFFRTLEQLQLKPVRHAFADHHPFRARDLDFDTQRPLVMTAKDAVKCRAFARPHWWYLSVSADLPETFWSALDRRLQALTESTGGDAAIAAGDKRP